MTDQEAIKLIAAIGAIFPNSPLDEETMAAHVRGLRAIAAEDAQAIFDRVYEHCTFFPAGAELMRFAREAAAARAKAAEASREHEIENRFRLQTGITPEQEAANVERLKAMTRERLKTINGLKATRAGKLPDDWEHAEPAPVNVDRTHCQACRGRDPRCPYCEGRGVVCPTCGGAHVLRRNGDSGERPLYVGCKDCTDWARQSEHKWDEHGYPIYERVRGSGRATVHAWRATMRAEAAA